MQNLKIVVKNLSRSYKKKKVLNSVIYLLLGIAIFKLSYPRS